MESIFPDVTPKNKRGLPSFLKSRKSSCQFGCGTIAKHHIEAYQKSGRAEVVVLADVVPEQVETLAKEYGINKIYTDCRKMLKDDSFSAVSVCVPNFLHCDTTVRALAFGKHVLCEKPMALNIR